MIHSVKYVLLVVTSIMAFQASAQSQEKKYAVMMLNFAKGMQWPSTASRGDFVIGVYEYPPLAAELNAYAMTTKLGGRIIRIKELGSPEEIRDCHVLFIPAYKTKRMDQILGILKDQPVLIVCNKPDYGRKGAGINFVLVDGVLKYEINSKAIEARGMKVSSNLKGLGILIE